MRRIPITHLLLVVLGCGATTYAATEISRSVLSAGGGLATSAHFTIQGTIGQPVGGTAQSLHFGIEPGFWPGVTPIVGDMNCDGIVNFDDINAFVLALSDPAGYARQYPNCDILNGDINGDGVVNFSDINPFVALLSG